MDVVASQGAFVLGEGGFVRGDSLFDASRRFVRAGYISVCHKGFGMIRSEFLSAYAHRGLVQAEGLRESTG